MKMIKCKFGGLSFVDSKLKILVKESVKYDLECEGELTNS